MELRGKYTLFAEGCRGHIGKQLIKRFNLDSDADAQHYGIGLKEIWEIDPAKHEPGLVVHTAGWPLDIMAPKTPAARSSITWKTTRWWSA
jgi:electron-transferring-flavoprotein dehydrogenase